MNSLLLIARIALAAVFAVAGVTKLADQAGSRTSMRGFGVPKPLVSMAALLLPFVELACAIALVSGRSASWGASGALALLLLFIVAIAANMALGRTPDCHCFGQLHSAPAGGTTLSRNLALAAIAGFVLWQGPGHGVTYFMKSDGSGFSRTDMILSLVVVTQAVVGVFVLYQLLRQNGRTLQRLEAIEAKLGVVAEPPSAPGLPVETAAPAFSLTALDEGGAVTLAGLRERGTSILLFFSEPDCGVCDTILPDVGKWQREHADRLVVVPISRGKAEFNRAKSRTHNVQGVLLQRDREVAELYKVEHSPSAVLVSDGRIASPLAVGAEAIRTLVKDATAPLPLKKGDKVPSIPLRDLNGGSLDLGKLKNRPTLLLFWNPSCGFCQQMLDDIKAWEMSRSKDAPELIVISGGSPKSNREQGFRSRLLLDARFEAGARFGAGGTPSAVIVDDQGRVASDVGVGAVAVMDLVAGATAVAQ